MAGQHSESVVTFMNGMLSHDGSGRVGRPSGWGAPGLPVGRVDAPVTVSQIAGPHRDPGGHGTSALTLRSPTEDPSVTLQVRVCDEPATHEPTLTPALSRRTGRVPEGRERASPVGSWPSGTATRPRGLPLTRWWRAGAGLLLLAVAALCARAASPKHVLILEPFEGDVAPFSVALSAFRSTLAREFGERLEFYEMTLDRARFQEPEAEGPLVQFLETRIANRPMDLVATTGGPGMDFVARHHERLFPDTPIVFLGGPPEAAQAGSLAGKATQVTVPWNLAGMVEDILQLQPQTTNIAVVFGASALETDTWNNAAASLNASRIGCVHLAQPLAAGAGIG